MGKDLVAVDRLLLTLNDAPSFVTFAGVEGDENVGRVEEQDDAGACTVICKHLKKVQLIRLDIIGGELIIHYIYQLI